MKKITHILHSLVTGPANVAEAQGYEIIGVGPDGNLYLAPQRPSVAVIPQRLFSIGVKTLTEHQAGTQEVGYRGGTRADFAKLLKPELP